MTHRITMVPFDECDWSAFSGATAAPDGTQPLLNSNDFDILVDGHPTTVIVDAVGIEMYLNNEDRYVLSLPNIHLALLIAQALPVTLASVRLSLLGFVKL